MNETPTSLYERTASLFTNPGPYAGMTVALGLGLLNKQIWESAQFKALEGWKQRSAQQEVMGDPVYVVSRIELSGGLSPQVRRLRREWVANRYAVTDSMKLVYDIPLHTSWLALRRIKTFIRRGQMLPPSRFHMELNRALSSFGLHSEEMSATNIGALYAAWFCVAGVASLFFNDVYNVLDLGPGVSLLQFSSFARRVASAQPQLKGEKFLNDLRYGGRVWANAHFTPEAQATNKAFFALVVKVVDLSRTHGVCRSNLKTLLSHPWIEHMFSESYPDYPWSKARDEIEGLCLAQFQ